ncbi:MAG TPA: hypothetical protein VGB76_22195 [Pyrinomonadaceae bacterium]|jgi:predicted DNA-binding protein (UPF0251 family)
MIKTNPTPQTISISEAQTRLGVSRTALWRLIRSYNIETFQDVLDARVKRVRVSDIQRVLDDADRVRRGIAA